MANKTLGEKLQSLPKSALYAILLAVTTIPLFFNLKVPNQPTDPAIDLYARLMTIPEGQTILIQSDWTNSTRGESGGQFEALMRLLMRRGVKFAVYSAADPQAPQVALDTIARVNQERRNAGERPYERWNDWVSLGYIPNAEAAGQAMAADFRGAFRGKRDFPPGGSPRDVFESPVLQGVRRIQDFPLMVIVTASKTSTIAIERLSNRVPIGLMVTGVMGPESQVYYASGQVVGLSAGLKGLYDIETLMEVGMNGNQPNTIRVDRLATTKIDGFPGANNAGKGTKYYPTLHFALTLLILSVIIGNIGMALSKRRAR